MEPKAGHLVVFNNFHVVRATFVLSLSTQGVDNPGIPLPFLWKPGEILPIVGIKHLLHCLARGKGSAEEKLSLCQYKREIFGPITSPACLFQEANRAMTASFSLDHVDLFPLGFSLSFLQDMYQEYMELSGSFLTASMEQGLTEILPVVSAALAHFVIVACARV